MPGDRPRGHEPTLGGAHAPADPGDAPMLGGPGAPAPLPLQRPQRDLSRLKALGIYFSRPGATGYVPDLEGSAQQDLAASWRPLEDA